MSRIYFSVFAIFFATALSCFAQDKRHNPEHIGKYKTLKNEVIDIYGEVLLLQQAFNFQLANGEYEAASHKEVKWMLVYNRAFISLPTKKDGQDLQLMEVLFISKDKILVQYWNKYLASYKFYIYDHKGNILMANLLVKDRELVKGAEKNNIEALAIMKTHFDCPEFIEALTLNLNNKENLSQDIAVFSCEGSPSLETILEGLDKKPWYKN